MARKISREQNIDKTAVFIYIVNYLVINNLLLLEVMEVAMNIEKAIEETFDLLKSSRLFLEGGPRAISFVSHMAQFCRVNAETPVNWIFRGILPIGEARIKVLFFLDISGFKVVYFEVLDCIIHKLGKIVAYGPLELPQIAGRIEYADPKSIFRLFGSKSGISKQKEALVEKLYSEYEKEILAKEQRWSKAMKDFFTGEPEAKSRAAETTVQIDVGTNSKSQVLETLGYQILATVSLAEAVASDHFSADERRRLREMTGKDAVFRLSTALNALCGEKSRETVIRTSSQKRNGETA